MSSESNNSNKETNTMGNYLIDVPDIGEGIAEVEIVEWPVAVGATVEEDDIICVVMTDKATVEIPSPIDGTLSWLGAEAGDMIAVGAKLVRLQVEGQGNDDGDTEVSITDEVKEESVISTPQVEIETVVEAAVVSTVVVTAPVAQFSSEPSTTIQSSGIPRPEGEKPIAAPAVRQRARNAGIDLHFVRGTGPANRITHEDLDSFIAGGATAPVAQAGVANTSVEEIKVIGLRRKIAKVMQDTMQRLPHFTYVEEVDVTELELLRAKLNKNRRDDQPKLTILPFIIKALAKAIKVYPEMSSRFDDVANVVHRYGAAHVGIATQTDSGLVVPVVKHAEALDIWGAASEVKRLSTACRNGSVKREELTGSTITITSLGPMGGIVTTPVINAPEVAIVSINKIAKRPVWQDGAFIPRDIMNLSSSFDHRIIDGWEATLFIQQMKGFLESPATLFMDN
ncbi:MAG: 2-oxoisovalerate dehydrogenase E2 component (dihydrolipoyl transacylase) [Enterobacterales bacterium]|jgi:2-oxoisovalerate dehydrogenase E2 component (dihydrolipoyl transacylase)